MSFTHLDPTGTSEPGAAYDPLGNRVVPQNPPTPQSPPPPAGAMYGPSWNGSASSFSNANNYATGCYAASNNPTDCNGAMLQRMGREFVENLPGYYHQEYGEHHYDSYVGFIQGGGNANQYNYWHPGQSGQTGRWDPNDPNYFGTLYVTDTSTLASGRGPGATMVGMQPLLEVPRYTVPGTLFGTGPQKIEGKVSGEAVPNDPCAGKKGALTYSQGKLTHIINTHIQQTPRNKGRSSLYTFGISTSDLSPGDRVDKVKALNQEAFEKGGAIPIGHGATAYVYAPYGGIGGVVEGFGVGKDARHGMDFTNVRTVTVGPDCKSVGTSYPGLPAEIGASDPRIVGSPHWWDAINTHF